MTWNKKLSRQVISQEKSYFKKPEIKMSAVCLWQYLTTDPLQTSSKSWKKDWSISKINEKLAKTFESDAIISFTWRKNLRELVGGNVSINNDRKYERQCRTCKGRKNTICCRNVKTITSFTGYKNKRTFKIFHNLTCQSTFLFYFVECVLCKIQWKN